MILLEDMFIYNIDDIPVARCSSPEKLRATGIMSDSAGVVRGPPLESDLESEPLESCV